MFGPKEVTVHEACEVLGTDGHCLLDVRTHEEVAEAAVPGSLHIPLDRLEDEAHKLKDFDSLHVMCRSGGRSSMATSALHGMGMKHARNMKGGILAWKAANLPTK
tara:strand:- start:402624 stop:402938 length:315 start_codon:yes stop_codon:yes gene_type:complete